MTHVLSCYTVTSDVGEIPITLDEIHYQKMLPRLLETWRRRHNKRVTTKEWQRACHLFWYRLCIARMHGTAGMKLNAMQTSATYYWGLWVFFYLSLFSRKVAKGFEVWKKEQWALGTFTSWRKQISTAKMNSWIFTVRCRDQLPRHGWCESVDCSKRRSFRYQSALVTLRRDP